MFGRNLVAPAEASAQGVTVRLEDSAWIPACAGMTDYSAAGGATESLRARRCLSHPP